MSQGGPDKKVANRLVTLGSAAVIAVYSAGYVRTQKAADSLAERASKGRPIRQPAASASDGGAIARVAAPSVPADRVPASADTAPNVVPPRQSAVGKADVPDSPIGSAAPVPAASPASLTPVAPAAEEPKPEPVVTPATAAISVQSPAAAAQPAASQSTASQSTASQSAAAQTTAVQPPVAQPAAPPKSVWKDGTFYGWGTSRHGDIQAAVVIEGGRIASATISVCQTRYPCDYIDHLPPQVAQRQSADVDSVSRATESADAFYFAVTNALAEAKAGK